MNKYFKSLLRLNDQKGVTALWVTLLMVFVLLPIISLAIDYGYAVVTRNQLQNVADAAALAATRKLGCIYTDCQGTPPDPMTHEEQQNYDATSDADSIKQAAKAVALKNTAGGKKITIYDSGTNDKTTNDIVIGRWKQDDVTKKYYLDPTLLRPNAVWVRVRRDSTARSNEGPITTWFTRIFGKDTTSISTYATAALTSQSNVLPGDSTNFALSEQHECGDRVAMHPTKDSCAGWHTFTAKTHSSSELRKQLQGQLPPDQTFVTPELSSGESEINMTGGDLASRFDDFYNLWDYMKDHDDTPGDGLWTVVVPIYADPDAPPCSNPSGMTKIVGFATMDIEIVNGPSEKEIWGTINCKVEPGHGGGGTDEFNMGSIPNLVDYPTPPSS